MIKREHEYRLGEKIRMHDKEERPYFVFYCIYCLKLKYHRYPYRIVNNKPSYNYELNKEI